MATMPNLNPTDPWTLTQKFLDQTAKENERKEYYAAMLEAESIKAQAKGQQLSPYEKQQQKNQADLEYARKADAEGFTGGRYRRPGQAKGATAKGGMITVGDRQFFDRFMARLKERGLTNPIGLAAAAATGSSESGWSSARVNSTWEDKSASGKSGTSGGAMSWREDRLQALYAYAAKRGEKPGGITPETQADFYYDEDGSSNNPGLMGKLQNSSSIETAMKEHQKAWLFGDNSAGARLQTAYQFLPTFGAAGPTAKQRTAGVEGTTQTEQVSTAKVDENGREYFEARYPPDTVKKIIGGMRDARTRFVRDPTTPRGPKGEATYREYTGRKGLPPTMTAAPASGAPVAAPATTAALPAAPATVQPAPAIVPPAPSAPALIPPAQAAPTPLQTPTTGMVKASGYDEEEEEEEEEGEE